MEDNNECNNKPTESADTLASFTNHFDGYVFLISAVMISILKVIELIFKKRQNNNFKILDVFNDDLKKLQTQFTTFTEIQSVAPLSKEQSPDINKEENLKRFSKSMNTLTKVENQQK